MSIPTAQADSGDSAGNPHYSFGENRAC